MTYDKIVKLKKKIGGSYMLKKKNHGGCLVFRSFTKLYTSRHPHSRCKDSEVKNCKALNKVYKGGVAKSKNTKNKGGKTKYKPYVSKSTLSKKKT
ncbi:hypothetical protein BsIDN1_08050 [Bacillus safensis]|uniref:Uncharacterized protein n=1 Tax=Bacillus safensis TaxID=561879 RepID=A0A5S9M0Q1_BACIA|nr:hypothetical protein BsIDN1_08050 [Bacillus safensis]